MIKALSYNHGSLFQRPVARHFLMLETGVDKGFRHLLEFRALLDLQVGQAENRV